MIPTVTTDKFNYVARDKVLYAEISDFGPNFNFGQVFPDAADEGLKLYNPRRGTTTVWAMWDIKRTDGDLMYWILKPVLEHGPVAGHTMIIYND